MKSDNVQQTQSAEVDARDEAIDYAWTVLVSVSESLPNGPVPQKVFEGFVSMMEGALSIAGPRR